MLSCVPYCAELMQDATISQQGRVRHDDVNRVAHCAIGLMCPHRLRNMVFVRISCIPTYGELSAAKSAVSNAALSAGNEGRDRRCGESNFSVGAQDFPGGAGFT